MGSGIRRSETANLNKANRVSRVERDLNTHSIVLTDNKNYKDEFVVKAKAESDSSESEEEKKDTKVEEVKPVEKITETEI